MLDGLVGLDIPNSSHASNTTATLREDFERLVLAAVARLQLKLQNKPGFALGLGAYTEPWLGTEPLCFIYTFTCYWAREGVLSPARA